MWCLWPGLADNNNVLELNGPVPPPPPSPPCMVHLILKLIQFSCKSTTLPSMIVADQNQNRKKLNHKKKYI